MTSALAPFAVDLPVVSSVAECVQFLLGQPRHKAACGLRLRAGSIWRVGTARSGTDSVVKVLAHLGRSSGWTFALNTPYRWTKQIASHFGGTRNGMAISWPRRISERGGIRHQFHHVIDVVPTILEAVGVQTPTMVNGILCVTMTV